MRVNWDYAPFQVLRDPARCVNCRLCEKECSNQVHRFDDKIKGMVADDTKCVNCHRCVAICPTRALKIALTDHTFRPNSNWTADSICEIYRQAESGGVLLSSMGAPTKLPVYWDKLLVNASQVTNPSIDPLREPMEL